MMSLDLPWGWILWAVAAVMATSSLVKLANDRRKELQDKLDNYVENQLKLNSHKKKIIAEHRRRVALAKKLAEENAKQDGAESGATE
jgi:t-SNARE complex subunit (syntaxin)